MNTIRLPILASLLFAITAWGTPVTHAASTPARNDSELTVNTQEGSVHGIRRDGVQAYLGIPYAQAPVDKLRWMPPQPVPHWQGVRDATQYANACPQVTSLGNFAGPGSISEDCLYLNVFTTGQAPSGHQKPVIVWIHGGGNFDGSSSDYDASKLATGGPDGVPSVVVTFNYRLGLLGTLSHPALNNEGHAWGNYNLLDQQAVLQWVRRNIAAFGGDPAHVALGGQSAGAYDTAANMLSPLSRDLFSRAIVMSSPGFAANFPSADTATAKGVAFAQAAGCTKDGDIATCLRKLSVSRILQLQGAPNMNSDFITGSPFIDGTILPVPAAQAWAQGRFNKVPVLGGSTEDEGTFFTGVAEYFSAPLFYGPKWQPVSPEKFTRDTRENAFCIWCVNAKMPADAADHYPLAAHGNDPMEAYQRLLTDIAKCGELSVVEKWSTQIPVYAYDFTYNEAPFYFPAMPGFKPGASHTADIQFVFPGFHGGPLGVNLDQTTGQPRALNPAETALSDQITAAWTRFAATGNPNKTGVPSWPALTGADGTYFVQDLQSSTLHVSDFRKKYQCDYWDKQFGR